MKKAFIINFHHVLNYGAVIQGYALTEFLRSKGVEAQIIDYRPFYFLSQTYRPAPGIKKSIRKWKMNKNFLHFRKNSMRITPKTLYSGAALKAYFKDSEDYFICGSDQVWNYKLTNNKIDEGYFLDFVPKTGKKISYAASLGHSKFPEEQRASIADRLKSYWRVSVREDFAQEEVKNFTSNQIDATVVADPSLILDDYSPILDYSLVPKQKYMVVYSTENSADFKEFTKRISEEKGFEVINLGHYSLSVDSTDYSHVRPSMWLGLFAKADYVCTNSFHGTAFSVIFRRNFAVLGRSTKKDLNTRQITLLGELGLLNQFVEELKDLQIESVSKTNYDDSFEAKFKAYQEHSRAFLTSALELG